MIRNLLDKISSERHRPEEGSRAMKGCPPEAQTPITMGREALRRDQGGGQPPQQMRQVTMDDRVKERDGLLEDMCRTGPHCKGEFGEGQT